MDQLLNHSSFAKLARKVVLLFLHIVWLFPVYVEAVESVPILGLDVHPLENPISCRAEYHRPEKWPDDRPVVAVAFAGGGARGLAHVGVIKVLEEEGVPVDLVTGTSMGGLVGGLWSLGYSGQQIDSLVSQIPWSRIFSDAPTHYELTGNARFQDAGAIIRLEWKDWGLRVPSGFIAGRRIEDLLSDLTLGYHGKQDFLQFPRSFACVATDVASGQRVYMTQGELLYALRATMSIPGMFAPVLVDSMLLVDGGLVENSPVQLAKRLGADIVILAGLQPPLLCETEIESMFSIAEQTMTISTLESEHRAARMADLAIMSSTGDVSTLDFQRHSEVIQLGYLAADDYRDRLRAIRDTVLQASHGVPPPTPPERAEVYPADQKLHINAIRFRSDTQIGSFRLQRMMDMYVGDTRPVFEIKDHVHRLVSSGGFQKATLQVLPRETALERPSVDLLLDLKAKQGWSADFYLRYNEEQRSILGLRLNWHNVFGPGSLDRMAIQLGGHTMVRWESWLGHFRNTGLYLHPHISYLSHEVFARNNDRSKLAGYRDRRYVLSLGVGWVVRNGARLESGLYYDHFLAEPEVADVYFTEAEMTARGLYTSFDLDLRDTREYPSKGSCIHARYNYAPDVLYRDTYQQLKGQAELYFSLPDPWFRAAGRDESRLETELSSVPVLAPMLLGQPGGAVTLEAEMQFAIPVATELRYQQIEPIGGPVIPGLYREEFWLRKYVTGNLGPRVWLNSFISVKPVFAFSHLAGSEIQSLPEGAFPSWGVELAGRSLFGPVCFMLSQRRGEDLLFTVEIGYE